MGTGPESALVTGGGDPLRPGPPRPRTVDARGVAPSYPLWDGELPTVLLIEDDPADALLVEELVADSGVAIRLRWARSFADAMKALDAEVPTASCSTCTCPTPRARTPSNGCWNGPTSPRWWC